LHLTHHIKTKFRRGKEGIGKEVGVFASRTPHRTSRIAISDVELIKVENGGVFVKGLDAFEGSPVLDIKALKNKNKKSLRPIGDT
jgi:tRNA (Thr-GGU) A37 N-methylase